MCISRYIHEHEHVQLILLHIDVYLNIDICIDTHTYILQEYHHNLDNDHDDIGNSQPLRHSSVTTLAAQISYQTLVTHFLVQSMARRSRSTHSFRVAEPVVPGYC